MAKKLLFAISTIDIEVIETAPPQAQIAVAGYALTSGWSDPELVPHENELSADGILDLNFVATPPDQRTLPVLSPISAHLVWEDDVDRLLGVKVYSRTGDHLALLHDLGFTFGVQNTPKQGRFTTLAIGEECSPPFPPMQAGAVANMKTMAEHEENPWPPRWPPIPPWPPKPFIGETTPLLDDPPPPDLINLGRRNPFGNR